MILYGGVYKCKRCGATLHVIQTIQTLRRVPPHQFVVFRKVVDRI